MNSKSKNFKIDDSVNFNTKKIYSGGNTYSDNDANPKIWFVEHRNVNMATPAGLGGYATTDKNVFPYLKLPPGNYFITAQGYMNPKTMKTNQRFDLRLIQYSKSAFESGQTLEANANPFAYSRFYINNSTTSYQGNNSVGGIISITEECYVMARPFGDVASTCNVFIEAFRVG